MEGSKNNLTEKEFWSDNWKSLRLPARFLNDYPHEVVVGTIDGFLRKEYESFLEIGGCPGRWADHFSSRLKFSCDSMDYDERNVAVTEKNYELLGIDGEVFLGDITDNALAVSKEYDVVLSDGLIEHFIDSADVFANHVRRLKRGGLLIIGVPNIKESWFYDYFSRFDARSYVGYRNVDKDELIRHAGKNDLEILYCDYIGVLNLGLVNTENWNIALKKMYILVHMVISSLLKILHIRKETATFSPYIYLIAKKV